MWVQLGVVAAAVAAVLFMTPQAVTQRIKRIGAKLEFQKRAAEANLSLTNSSKPLLPRSPAPVIKVVEEESHGSGGQYKVGYQAPAAQLHSYI